MIKITLVKSLIATLPNKKATAQSLGLKKQGDFVIVNDNAAIRGKIYVLGQLVKVENV